MTSGRGYWNVPVAMTPAASQWHKTAAITSPYDGAPLKLTLLVLCANQAASIAATLDNVIEAVRVAALSYEIIVIDDASKDGSADLLRRYIEAHPGINMLLILNTQKKGPAQNYIDAAFIGRGKYYRLIPHSEPLETMIDMLGATGEADIIVPYYIASMQEGSPQLISKGCTRFINLATGNRINCYNGSPVHLRFNVMRWHCGSDGTVFQTGLLCRLLALGFTCKQVPCRTTCRAGLSWKEALSLPPVLLEGVIRRLSGWLKKR